MRIRPSVTDVIDRQIERLKIRQKELTVRVIPELENKTETLYQLIMPMRKDSEERHKLELEYGQLAKELRLRCDELLANRQQVANLEVEKGAKR